MDWQPDPYLASLQQARYRGLPAGEAIVEEQKAQAYVNNANANTEATRYRLAEEMRMQDVMRNALPQIMQGMAGKSGTEILQELAAQGVPYDAAISIADSISKAQQREQMGSFIESQMSGAAPGAGGGNNLSKVLAMQQAMRGDPSALISLQSREDQVAREEKQYRDQVSIPGYEPAEGFRPTVTDASEVKKAARSASKIKRLGEQLKQITLQNGFQPGVTLPLVGTKIGSKEYRQMNRIYKAIQLEQKNIDDLGALVGADFQFIGQAPDPTSFFESESYGSPEEFAAQMDEYLDNIQLSADETAKFYGYQPSVVRKDAKTEDDDLEGLLSELKKRGLK